MSGNDIALAGTVASVIAAIAAIGGLIVSMRSMGFSSLSMETSGPHVEHSFTAAGSPEYVYFHLAGPNVDQWRIVRARISRRSRMEICRKIVDRDIFGGPEIVEAIPQGRSLSMPDSPLVLSAPPTTSTVIVFDLEYKANSRIKRRSEIRLNATA